ncbi:MAG: efflux RND transporter periplasmic adaptor subunit [Deferribacteres bacterium]|nr:efflux RND transporter periplasmic adaptor subunit [Deferribacteres bacterium]
MSIQSLFQQRRWLVLAGASVVVLILFFWNIGSQSADIASYETEAGEFIVSIDTKGELVALNSQSVNVPRSIRSNVQIVRMAPEGDVVKAGDFLVQFDQTQARQKFEEENNEYLNALAELESKKASIASNTAQLQSALQTQKYSHEQAKLRYEQMKFEAEAKRREQEINLRKAELALKQAEEKIEAQKKIDEADLEKARLQSERQLLQKQEAEHDLQSLTLTAPIDGLVVYKEIWGPSGRAKVKVGDTPWRGMPLIEIPDLSVMQVKTSVNEVDVSRVAKGQQVHIKLDALPDPDFYGTVSQVATLASRKRNSNIKEFEVYVLVDGSDPRLKPGMSASLEIITDKIDSAMYVPLESVFEKDGKTIVYLAGSNKPVEVQVGQKNADYVVIKSGLSPGQRVCLRDPTLPLEDIGGEEPKPIEKKKKKKESGGEGFMIIG